MGFIDHVASGFRRRIPAMLVVAASIGGAIFAIYEAPWFRATIHRENLHDRSFGMQLLDPSVGLVDSKSALAIVVAFGALYFFGRMFMTLLLLFLNGPTTRKVAWLSSRRAEVHCCIVLLAAFVVFFVATPHSSAPVDMDYSVEVQRSWGGLVFLAALVLANVAIKMIARDPALGATQGWNDFPDDDLEPLPREKKQRPMLARSPLPGPPMGVESDPFRQSPALAVEAKLIKPPVASVHAPRVDDANAPKPSFLS